MNNQPEALRDELRAIKARIEEIYPTVKTIKDNGGHALTSDLDGVTDYLGDALHTLDIYIDGSEPDHIEPNHGNMRLTAAQLGIVTGRM